MPSQRNSVSLVGGWACLCAFLNATGWLLSALHALNRLGYAVAFLAVAFAVVIFRKQFFTVVPTLPNLRKLRRRFTRLFPASFILLAALAILGGALHPPANYDGLAYRVPRILNWLADERWHWIHTDFHRLNTRICGIEWISAPLILFL